MSNGRAFWEGSMSGAVIIMLLIHGLSISALLVLGAWVWKMRQEWHES